MITDISQLDPNGTYTYADYLKWQFEEWIELLNGRYRIFNKSGKSPVHQDITNAIGWQIYPKLDHSVYASWFTPLPVIFGDVAIDVRCTVVIPDFFVMNRKANWEDEIGWHGIPDWIIEESDPLTESLDSTVKRSLYEQYGIREYWVVQPKEKAVNVYVLEEGKYALADVYESGEVPSRIFPDLLVSYDRIFE